MLKKPRKSLAALTATAALSAGLGWMQPANAAEPFLAEIVMFGGNFAPRGWALCDGQLLPISSNTALFSLLGTTYGGDGRTTFALPDLRGRIAMHPGTGAGLSQVRLGEKGGAEARTLTTNQMPAHTHLATTSVDSVQMTLNGTNGAGDDASPGGRTLARKNRTNIYSSSAPDVAMHSGSITGTATASTALSNSGAGQSFSIRNPYLGVNHIIALQGIFPSRN